MNSSSSDLRSPGHPRTGTRDSGSGIRDLKSAPGASGRADDLETTDAADRAAFGEFLRQARERRQLTLEQIANDTKISSRHLTALEEGNLKSLPGGMYRRAMLRAYADSVGLDKDAALEQFERTFQPGARPGSARAAANAASATAVQEVVATPSRKAERKGDVRISLIGIVIAATAIVALVTGDRSADLQSPPGAGAAAGEAPATATPQASVEAASPRAGGATTDEITPVAPSAPAAAVNAGRTPPANATPVRPDAALPAAASSAPPRSPPAEAATARTETANDAVTATTGGADAVTEPRPAPIRAVVGEIVIATDPAGARVTIDGTGWGTTPVTVRNLPFGTKRVRVTRDGYVSQERSVSVSPDRPGASLRLTLQPRE